MRCVMYRAPKRAWVGVTGLEPRGLGTMDFPNQGSTEYPLEP